MKKNSSANAKRKTKKVSTQKGSRSLKEWFLIAVGIKKPSRYKVSKCGRLRIDRERGVLEPNWDNEEVRCGMGKSIKNLRNMSDKHEKT